MVRLARRLGAYLLVDGAQSVFQMPANVQEMDCDWFVFFEPQAVRACRHWRDLRPRIGLAGDAVLAGRQQHDPGHDLRKNGLPVPAHRFERHRQHSRPRGAWAPPSSVSGIGMSKIARCEHDLLLYATRLLVEISGSRITGTAAEKAGILTFVLRNISAEEVGRALTWEGITVRAYIIARSPFCADLDWTRRFALQSLSIIHARH